MKEYLFQSERLGFRNWQAADVEKMALINSDPEVMAFFPSTETFEQTQNFISRMQQQFLERGCCYFAVEEIETGQFIGFIGLSEKTFEADFTPCTDIGWRLGKSFWNKGYATEGAKRCLQFGFADLGLEKILAIAPKINTNSEKVMQKIGMEKLPNFKHPLLDEYPRLQECVLYQIKK